MQGNKYPQVLLKSRNWRQQQRDWGWKERMSLEKRGKIRSGATGIASWGQRAWDSGARKRTVGIWEQLDKKANRAVVKEDRRRAK